MEAEALFEETIKLTDTKQLRRSTDLLLEEWVYFFMWEKPGTDTPVSTDNVTYIITTGKDNPINIPWIDDGEDRFGVLHVTKELAMNMAEFTCKVAQMKGRKALELFRSVTDGTAVALQSSNFNVHLYDEDIDRTLSI